MHHWRRAVHDSSSSDAELATREAAQARELVGDALVRFLILDHLHQNYRCPRYTYTPIAFLITSNAELNVLAAEGGLAPFAWRGDRKALASALEEHVYALFISDGLEAARNRFITLIENRYDLAAMAQSFDPRRGIISVLKRLDTRQNVSDRRAGASTPDCAP